MFYYLLTGALAALVIACVLDDIHIYDMFFDKRNIARWNNTALGPADRLKLLSKLWI